MQLLNFKLFTSFLVVLAFFFGSATFTLAAAPEIIGEVRFKDNRPIPGIWVKWTDEHGSYRFAQTNNEGKFSFPSWHRESGKYQNEERQTRIDSDSDGSLDTYLAVVHEEYDGGAFGCGENPHTFTVVPKKGMVGTFTNATIRVDDLINSKKLEDIGVFYFETSQPTCPANLRYSCDKANSRVTIAWDAVDQASRYELKVNKQPFETFDIYDWTSGDFANTTTSTQHTFSVTLNYNYQWSIQTVREVDGNVIKSEECSLQQFVCLGDPPTQDPVGTLSVTSQCRPDNTKPDGYALTHNYNLHSINTFGLPLVSSEIMLGYGYNSKTQKILDFLNDAPNSKTADYSRWQQENREPREDDWFIFSLHKVTSLGGNNQYSYALTDDSRIGFQGKKTVAQFREFLMRPENADLPKDSLVTGNLLAVYGESGYRFNSYIPSNVRTEFVLTPQEAGLCRACATGTCVPVPSPTPTPQCSGTAACVGADPITAVVIPDEGNKVTIEWQLDSPTPAATFDLVFYNKANYTSSAQAVAAWKAKPFTAKPTDVAYFENLTTTSKVIDLDSYPTIGTQYAYAVNAYKTTCTTFENSCWTPDTTIDPGYTVIGRFYDSSTCAPINPVALPNSVVSASSATGTGPDAEPVTVTDDTYQITIPAVSGAQYNVGLTIAGDDYICATSCNPGATPTSCNFRFNPVAGEKNDAHFFVQKEGTQYTSWWQVWGGLVYGHTRVESNLPLVMPDKTPNAECDDLDNPGAYCQPFLVRRGYNNFSQVSSAGVPITFGGFSNLVNGWWSHRDDRIHAEGADSRPTPDIKEDYAYFKSKFSDIPGVPGGEFTTLGAMGAGQTVDDTRVWNYTSSITLKPSTTFTVTGGEKRVVLINGDLTLMNNGPDQLIKVDHGSYLMFVVTGNIYVHSSVGYEEVNSETASTSVTPNIEGVYVANNEIVIQSTGTQDRKFVGAGIFIGWNNVQLQRSFDNPDDSGDDVNRIKNTTTPVETFIFRPDFAAFAPEPILDSHYTWKEVN